ncbi:hypothetical protein AN958_10642 [Leucoagaricus sp. SymC.cos]|nr:hypothetical protein AN958_10642 [Leucoagaricus sp. SymC.cos]
MQRLFTLLKRTLPYREQRAEKPPSIQVITPTVVESPPEPPLSDGDLPSVRPIQNHSHPQNGSTSHSQASATRKNVHISQSAFSYAHNFSIFDPTFIEAREVHVNQPSSYDRRSEKVREWLHACALWGVEYNSFDRDPPPRCCAGTREQCITDIENYVQNIQSKPRLLWINGPAGVGKTAILQTLAERFRENGQPVATIFFPKDPGGQLSSSSIPFRPLVNPSSKLWVTLAYRLATLEPSYLAYLVEHAYDDPMLVHQNMATQFDAFIGKPFGRGGLSLYTCIPVILDGFECCHEQETQEHILDLIIDFISCHPSCPLVWLISSRSEDYLVRKFQQYDRLEELVRKCDISMTPSDVQAFMEAAFEEIRNKHGKAIQPLPWPTAADLEFLVGEARGFFVLAAAFADFVRKRSPQTTGPMTRLNNLISLLNGQEYTSPNNSSITFPLSPVHDMYSRLLQKVELYDITKRILGFYLLPQGFGGWTRDSTPFWSLCNILGIDHEVAYHSLSNLHSLLDVPELEDATTLPLRFFHLSFADYLLNRAYSGRFWISLEEVMTDIWNCHCRALKEANGAAHTMVQPSKIELSWKLSAKQNDIELFQSRFWESARLSFFHHLSSLDRTSCFRNVANLYTGPD